MKVIFGVMYIAIGVYSFTQVIAMPGAQLAFAFCSGVTIAYGIKWVAEGLA